MSFGVMLFSLPFHFHETMFYPLIRYFPVSEVYIQTSGVHLHHQPKMENPGTTWVYCSVYIFYRESSGNNYLSAISDHNMPERQNYFHFFSGEPAKVPKEVKHESGLFMSSFFKVLDVFPVTNIDSNQGSSTVHVNGFPYIIFYLIFL